MSEENFSNKEIEQIEHLGNTHTFVAEELENIKALQKVKADFTQGYSVDKTPKIEIYVYGLPIPAKVRLLKAVNEALANEIKQIVSPSVDKITATLKALYG